VSFHVPIRYGNPRVSETHGTGTEWIIQWIRFHDVSGYGWPQLYGADVKQRAGKAMVDLSRIPMSDIVPGQVNAHRLLKTHCNSVQTSVRPPYSSFIVYHYTGRFAEFSYRVDGRESRTRAVYEERRFNYWYDDRVPSFGYVGLSSKSGMQMLKLIFKLSLALD
jgi:hypothetical protein